LIDDTKILIINDKSAGNVLKSVFEKPDDKNGMQRPSIKDPST
jgi:hypothetical protein